MDGWKDGLGEIPPGLFSLSFFFFTITARYLGTESLSFSLMFSPSLLFFFFCFTCGVSIACVCFLYPAKYPLAVVAAVYCYYRYIHTHLPTLALLCLASSFVVCTIARPSGRSILEPRDGQRDWERGGG
ncbi:uncharacterized protein B0H64DRAFT_28492 [Chaetomium fimeti]|uniref:Uncharacterized protein n=1 Tax=Chaetomium fimeti TaxID=1854472 RepID=A0AAE0LY56_9PEZI|nr:hypothetical protein B0H64DRAFT_28492 [Chaetomium fimeti]